MVLWILHRLLARDFSTEEPSGRYCAQSLLLLLLLPLLLLLLPLLLLLLLLLLFLLLLILPSIYMLHTKI